MLLRPLLHVEYMLSAVALLWRTVTYVMYVVTVECGNCSLYCYCDRRLICDRLCCVVAKCLTVLVSQVLLFQQPMYCMYNMLVNSPPLYPPVKLYLSPQLPQVPPNVLAVVCMCMRI